MGTDDGVTGRSPQDQGVLSGSASESDIVLEVDAKGLACPMPLLKAKRALNGVATGDCVRIQATDSSSLRDFNVYAQQTGNELVQNHEQGGVYTYVLRKG